MVTGICAGSKQQPIKSVADDAVDEKLLPDLALEVADAHAALQVPQCKQASKVISCAGDKHVYCLALVSA